MFRGAASEAHNRTTSRVHPLHSMRAIGRPRTATPTISKSSAAPIRQMSLTCGLWWRWCNATKRCASDLVRGTTRSILSPVYTPLTQQVGHEADRLAAAKVHRLHRVRKRAGLFFKPITHCSTSSEWQPRAHRPAAARRRAAPCSRRCAPGTAPPATRHQCGGRASCQRCGADP